MRKGSVHVTGNICRERYRLRVAHVTCGLWFPCTWDRETACAYRVGAWLCYWLTMLVGRILLALLVCCGNLYLIEAGSIACEAAGVGAGVAASCKPVGECPCCRNNEDEIVRCWPQQQSATKGIPDHFSFTRTIGDCPSENPFQDYGGCVDDAMSLKESGYRHRVHSLAISYEEVNLLSYNITVSWAYVNGDPSPGFVSAYSLWVTGNMIPSPGYYCVCINSSLNLTKYSFTVDYKTSNNLNISATVFTFPHASGAIDDFFKRKVERTGAPSSCADYQSGLQYNRDTCGLPRYGKPKHIKVKQNGTHTVISWEKPCFARSSACDLLGHGLVYVDPETYFLTLTYDNDKYYLEVSNATEVVLNTSENLHVKVQAYIPCSGLYEYRYNNEGSGNGCSLSGEVEDFETDVAACCPFVSSSVLPTPTLIPSPLVTLSAAPPFPSQVALIVSATTTVAVLILLITTTICLIGRYFRKRKFRKHQRYDMFLDEPILNIPVLLVYSPRTPEVERKAIQQTLVFDLRDQYGIASHAPELRNEKHSLYDWMTEHHERAHAVFCVCNRYFYEEWNQTANLENNPSAVYLFKSLFEGNINSDKYAVVLTDVADNTYVPPLLKCRQKYMIDDLVGITRFARDLRHFTT